MPVKTSHFFVFAGVPFAVCCWFLLLFAASGCQYESHKLQHFLLTISIVFIVQFVILDPIKFVIEAIVQSFLQNNPKWSTFRYGIPRAKKEHDVIRFFKMKIDWGKSRLSYNWRHRDETLNIFYKNVTRDLLIYGRYFIALIILINIFNEPLKYYHADGLRKVFARDRTTQWDIVNLEGMQNLWAQLEDVLINMFDNEFYNASIATWIPDEMSKLISVIRLEQIRLKHRMLGLGVYTFEDEKFLPGWKEYFYYPYDQKYWRTYSPWIPKEVDDGIEFYNTGYLSDYPQDRSYVAYFARSLKNSRKVFDFLREQNWLDRLTAALFVDFTLYSVDSNLFCFCRLTIECTPFGSIILHRHFESDVLLLNSKFMNNWYWLFLLIYTFLLVSFAKILVLKAWYGSLGSLLNFWNILDVLIVIFNILFFLFLYLREESVLDLIEKFETSTKEMYISFRTPKIMSRCVEITLAMLVFCATIRLWKVLLFAQVFRLYLRTLQLGAADIFWALMNIMVFLIGLMISSYLVNGPSRTNSHAPLSLVHILSFSLGYSERVNPMESSEIKSKALGVIIYALMMFGVTLILLNMLITLICIHYANAKEEERSIPKPKITYWKFIKVEYSQFFQFFSKLRQKIDRKLRGNKLFEKLKKKLWHVEKKLGVPQKKMLEWDPEEIKERHETRLRRVRIMTDILMTQTAIINHHMKSLNIKFDSNDAKTEKPPEN